MTFIVNKKNIDLSLASEPEKLNDFEKQCINFAKAWLNGTKSFNIQSSGSTGKPKTIILKRELMEYSARQTIDKLKLQKEDKALVCLNTSYVGGMMMLVRALIEEMKIECVEPSSNPLKNHHKYFDFIALAPLQLETILLQNNEQEIKLLNQAKAVIVGGAAVSTSLIKQTQALECPIYSTYGMTETISHIGLKRLNGNKAEKNFTTLGDCQLKTDSRGCLVINGKITQNQDIVTNDLVEIFSENEFLWLGRIDNVINSAGIKFQTETLESKIKECISENYFITGIPCNTLGEKISLWIENSEKTKINQNQKKAILENLNKKLSKYEKIRELFFVNKFEYTPTDKIQRKKTVALQLGH